MAVARQRRRKDAAARASLHTSRLTHHQISSGKSGYGEVNVTPRDKLARVATAVYSGARFSQNAFASHGDRDRMMPRTRLKTSEFRPHALSR
jgi:hypothetical protein